MHRSRAAGSGRLSSAPTTGAGPGRRPEAARRPPRTACLGARAIASSTTPRPETGKPLTTHQWYDGTQHPWEFKRVWHLEPATTDPDLVYAGVEDAALFRSTDGGRTWGELAGLRGHESGPRWQPGAGGMGLHTIVLDPGDPKRIFIAISAAGVFRSDDGGRTWAPKNRGLRSEYIPEEKADVGHCVHRHRDARVPPGYPLHAETLGHHADRRRRRVLARGQRQPAVRFRIPDRRSRPRAGDHLRRPDQERLGALPARGENSGSTGVGPGETTGRR